MKFDSLVAIVRTLEEAKVRYLVVGGLAVAAHGYGRVTYDVDLVVQLQPDNARHAIVALQSLEYRPLVPISAEDFADSALREIWKRDKNMVVLQLYSERHRETGVDLFIDEPFNFDAEYNTAMVGEIVPGLQTRFLSLDTLIRMKEATDRDKDREDVRQLKLLREKFDHDR